MDDTGLPPLEPGLWPPELSDVLGDMQGNPLNVHRLMAHHPSLLSAWWPFRNHVVSGGSLGQRRAELLILRLAVHMQSWYEWGAHVDRALAVGIDRQTIDALLQPLREGDWSAEETLLLRAVDELTYDHALQEATLAELKTHYSTDQIMDLMAIHGMYQILAAMIRAWNLQLDEDIGLRIAPYTDEGSFLMAARTLLTE